jgi:hypothetical protein
MTVRLLTKALEARLPALYAQDGRGDEAMAYVKFFTPWSNWTWYGTEYDPATRTFFGLVKGHETELGYFSLDELAALRGPYGLRVERDLSFRPTKLAELRAAEEAA